MDEFGNHDLPNPYDETNPISRIFHWWSIPFLKKGYISEITLQDIYNVPFDDSSEIVHGKLQRSNQRSKKINTNVLSIFWSLYGLRFTFDMLLGCVGICALLAGQTILIGLILKSADDQTTEKTFQKHTYVGVFVAVQIVASVMVAESQHLIQHLGIKMRVINNDLIYRKCLSLSQSSLSKTSAAKILNHMSVDATALERFLPRSIHLGSIPVALVIVLVIIWSYAGSTILAGFCFYVLVNIVLCLFQIWQTRIRRKTVNASDERLRLTKDVLAGMKVIKMFAWEKAFLELINKLRRMEIDFVYKTIMISAADIAFQLVGPRIAVILTLFTMTSTNVPITTAAIFMLLFAFNRIFTVSFTHPIRDFISSFVSSVRISDFLNIEEYQEFNNKPNDNITNCDLLVGEIKLKSISASWELTSGSKTLANISLNISPGTFNVIIGEVGSSKTSLLMAIIGELQLSDGNVGILGRLAYTPQEPWVFPGSLRKNILLGQPFDRERYSTIIKVSQLHKDLENFENGDKTLLGDNGVSVSGGQKARIGLARCLYHEADIYLMDDPLSAVDAEVGSKIFKECLTDFLAKKTRILVTHQIHFISKTDHILELSKGKSRFSGSYAELVRTSTRLVSLLEKNEQARKKQVRFVIKERNFEENENNCKYDRKFSDMNEGDMEELQKHMKELKATGGINKKHYFNYIKAGGTWTFIMLLTCFILAQAFATTFDCWLRSWSRDNNMVFHYHHVTALVPAKSSLLPVVDQTSTNLIIEFGLTVGVILFTILRIVIFATFCKNASLKLHTGMLNGILRSKVNFFDFNSSGRILNRFSNDLTVCDEFLPILLLECTARFFMAASVVVPVVMACYWMALLSLVLVAIFIIATKIYLKSSSELKRYEAITRSSVFQHVQASIDGLTTIRAMNLRETFAREFQMLQDRNTSVAFMCFTVNRWLGLVTELPCVAYICLLAVILLLNDSSPNDSGLALATGSQLLYNVQICIFYMAEAISQITSVERVSEYTMLEPEAELETKEEIKRGKDIQQWPLEGKIEFQNVSARYESTEIYSLRNIFCTILPKEKIGIVGRTGAGKSSFLNALFRIIEPQGQIIIDGINIMTLGLHDLRKKISIIPQDPILFAGSLRMNVDPFGEYSDEQIMNALADVQLGCLLEANSNGIQQEEKKLSSLVTSGGSNLSVGQRQLLCLARAILRDNKILVMDEATANVDRNTDELIQTTIRQRFKNCTVLTIAHRLNTIIDSDRIIVLQNGKLVEFDAPYSLLQDKEGQFAKLVEQTGSEQQELLTNIAYSSYRSRL